MISLLTPLGGLRKPLSHACVGYEADQPALAAAHLDPVELSLGHLQLGQKRSSFQAEVGRGSPPWNTSSRHGCAWGIKIY